MATFLVAVVSSLVASAVFLFGLVWLRPKMLVSPQIAREQLRDGSFYYQIKMINRTRFDLVRLHAELLHTQHIDIPAQDAVHSVIPLWHTRPVALKRPQLLRLARYKKNDTQALYAFRFVAYDIEADSSPEDQFIFRVYSEHWLSGFGTTVEVKYVMDSIVNGDFWGGDSLAIREEFTQYRKPTKPKDPIVEILGQVLDRLPQNVPPTSD